LPNGFNTSTPALPAATGAGNKVTNIKGYPVMVYQTGGVDPRKTDRLSNTLSIGGATSFRLLPSKSVYANATVPTLWVWEGL
jgi:hypothetical protein